MKKCYFFGDFLRFFNRLHHDQFVQKHFYHELKYFKIQKNVKSKVLNKLQLKV